MKNTCACCNAPTELVTSKSKLKKGVSFQLCGLCASEGHEPKFWLILFGRANGVRAVERALKGPLYCGNEILARELV